MGLIPGDGSCWQLPRLIGLSNTFLLQYTGDRVDGTEAHRMGMVSKVVPDDQLQDTAMELATRLAQGPTQSLSMIKYLIQKSLETNLRESLDISHIAQEQARTTEDHKEAVQAFLEKRRERRPAQGNGHAKLAHAPLDWVNSAPYNNPTHEVKVFI